MERTFFAEIKTELLSENFISQSSCPIVSSSHFLVFLMKGDFHLSTSIITTLISFNCNICHLIALYFGNQTAYLHLQREHDTHQFTKNRNPPISQKTPAYNNFSKWVFPVPFSPIKTSIPGKNSILLSLKLCNYSALLQLFPLYFPPVYISFISLQYKVSPHPFYCVTI